MNNWKNYIIIGLFSILIVFGIIVSIKCVNLEKENIKLKIEHNTVMDSIKVENKNLENEILLLSDNLEYCQYKIDSLKKVKQKVIIKTEYVVSEDLTEAVKILKENIRCEKY